MKYTNKLSLPEGIANAIIYDEYDKGNADYSVSGLIMPPQIMRLFTLYADQIEIDVSDRIWTLLGTAVHYVLERNNSVSAEKLLKFRNSQIEELKTVLDVSDTSPILMDTLKQIIERQPPENKNQFVTLEERMYASIGGIRISGKPDWYNSLLETTEDYKITSVWKILKGEYRDYIEAQNIYRWLLAENDRKVKKLQINAICKDWKKYEVSRTPEYPSHPVVTIELPVWKMIDTVQFVLNRVRLHESAREVMIPDELADRFPCSSEDRWEQPSKYKVQKPDAQRAWRVFENEAEARALVAEKPEYIVKVEPGRSVRCEDYCIVKDFCYQYNNKRHTHLPVPEEQATEHTFTQFFESEPAVAKPQLVFKNPFSEEEQKTFKADAITDSLPPIQPSGETLKERWDVIKQGNEKIQSALGLPPIESLPQEISVEPPKKSGQDQVAGDTEIDDILKGFGI
jgi:hypothetical protein